MKQEIKVGDLVEITEDQNWHSGTKGKRGVVTRINIWPWLSEVEIPYTFDGEERLVRWNFPNSHLEVIKPLTKEDLTRIKT